MLGVIIMLIASQAWLVMASTSTKAELRNDLAAQGREGAGGNPPPTFSFQPLVPLGPRPQLPSPTSPSPGGAKVPYFLNMHTSEMLHVLPRNHLPHLF